MVPRLNIQVCHQPAVYRPGDVIRCEYQIDAVDAKELAAVEASLLWMTEGKGDEDMGVHFFQRRVAADTDMGDLRPWHQFEATLPNSPLSYHGELVQVRWCVRVRLFMKSGKEHCAENPFVLTTIVTTTPACVVPHDSST